LEVVEMATKLERAEADPRFAGILEDMQREIAAAMRKAYRRLERANKAGLVR
jgi:serine/threonine-protein kinase RIO1